MHSFESTKKTTLLENEAFSVTQKNSSNQEIRESISLVSSTMWKNEEFTAMQNIFRQINLEQSSLVKKLLSRKFCDKMVTVKFRNFHTVSSLLDL